MAVLEPAHDPVVRYVAPQQVAAVPEVDRPLGPAARRVTRTEPDGKITVLIDRFDGKPLNAPNDVVVAR
jgi:sugar lactone lactonase YvrE